MMFGKRIRLFNLMGFEVRIDASWIFIAVLVVWSLATGLFPYEYKGLSRSTYWLMGLLGALGLFLSIIVHEFAHSLVARRFGLPMHGITLFIFGGVAEMSDEPPSPKAEFLMAVVGPLSSIALAALFYALVALGVQSGWPESFNGITRYLALINGLLALFNLIPAFPLDGGRILRSILWQVKGNLRWATRISSTIGSFFGILLIVYGFSRMFYGNLFGGMWMILIGMFVQNAARASYKQLLVRKALEGEPVSRFMNVHPVTVSPSTSVEQLVEDYIYRYHFNLFPVVDGGKLLGCVRVDQVKDIPRESRGEKTVADLMNQCSLVNTISPQTDAVKLLSVMNGANTSHFMVVENGRLVGMISLKDLLRFLSMKVELEG